MQRLVRMDGLRGVLAVYVMLGHALPFTDLPGWITAPFRHGEAAVDLFFALSGLVIAPSLGRHGFAFWPFMAARARRLLPVYFAVLAGACALLAAGNPAAAMPWIGGEAALFWGGVPADLPAQLAAHVLLLHGLLPQGALPYAYVTLLGPAWSLSTEWQFYLLIGLAAPRRLGWFALGLLGLGAVYVAAPGAQWWQFGRAFLPSAAPYFALGIASAVWLRGGRSTAFWLCLAGAVLCGWVQAPDKALPPLIWALVLAAQRARWGAVLAWRPLLALGAISYPLYLVNEPVQRGLALLVLPVAAGDAARFTALWLPASVAASLALAWALHRTLEAPAARKAIAERAAQWDAPA